MIEAENGTVTLFVMPSSGGMGPSATVTVKRLASLLAEKSDSPYSVMLNAIRCKLPCFLLSFAMPVNSCFQHLMQRDKSYYNGARLNLCSH